jgi:biopolymer transport protein TolQ
MDPVLSLAANSVEFWGAIRDNDWFGKLCLFVLIALSFASFTLIFHKLRTLSAASRQNSSFQRLMDGDGSWETLFAAARKYSDSPMARLLREIYVECRLEKWFTGHGNLTMEGRIELARQTVEGTLAKCIHREEERLASTLSFLSMTSTLAPFIGLLGTVWGILACFQSIGKEGSAALSALAPGISTALMTTVFGLFAAIPALIAYNYFMGRVKALSNSMETFAHDLENAVRKQIAKEKGAPK